MFSADKDICGFYGKRERAYNDYQERLGYTELTVERMYRYLSEDNTHYV